jgi:hypothetical protein
MLHLAYGSLLIDVLGDRAAPLAWLAEFLAGAFAPAPPGASPDATVELAVDAARLAEVEGDGEIDAFTRDGAFQRLRARRRGDGTLAMRDGPVGFLVRGRATTVLAAEDGAPARRALLRVVRELATTHALARGLLHVHAAAVEVGGRVFALAGPRRSGKTTLLVHALRKGGARYVTNDRLFVDALAAAPTARGMPTIITLRDETLARFPELAQAMRDRRYARHLAIRECAGTLPEPAPASLSPAQLCALTGANPAGPGPLHGVAFLAVDPAVARFEVRPLDAPEAAARLRASLLLAALPERAAEAFAGAAPPRDAATLERLCAELARHTPCLDVRLGPGAYLGPTDVWDGIRERLP